jgi:diacylglycerol kinase family enzyme
MSKNGHNPPIEVIATTISGSISDWSKVERIVPLFVEHGWSGVTMHAVDSHAEARQRACELVADGSLTLISAGGSGTFNAVLEGCMDSGVCLERITLGFLRKGSADLIGKVLGMPDEVEAAVGLFVESLSAGRTVGCDVVEAVSGVPDAPARHFVGYGGAEIFGRIPHYTENRFTKYYKGFLSQLFGDMGPFFVGATLSVTDKLVRRIGRRKLEWAIRVDGREVSRATYQALIIVNGDLGPNLPFARSVPLGSGDFHLFGIRDLGLRRLAGQFRHAWDASVLEDPDRWGFEHYRVAESLELQPVNDKPFPVNVDGSTLRCSGTAAFRIVDQIRLISS